MLSAERIGTRIVVYGATGSGKTTFARRTAGALGLRVIELDAIRHERGWDSTGWEELEQRILAAIAESPAGWICEGNYSRIAHIALGHADTVIWLHLPWRVSFFRLLKRTLRRAYTREPLYNENGPRESWRMTFLSRQSILWWSIHHHRATGRRVRERLAGVGPGVQVSVLRSARQVAALLAEIELLGHERTASGSTAVSES